MGKLRKRIVRKPVADLSRMPLWLTDGFNRAAGKATTEGMDTAMLSAIGQAKAGTSDKKTINTIGKFVAYIRMLCNMDFDARKENGHTKLWALSVQCAEIYRDLISELNDNGSATLGEEEADLLGVLVSVGMNNMRRHTEQQSAFAWAALDDGARMLRLLGIDPETGKHNADDGKLEQFFAIYDKEAA